MDCEETYKEIAGLIGPDNAQDLAFMSFAHRKNLYRDGIFSCTGTASIEEAPEDVRSGNLGTFG